MKNLYNYILNESLLDDELEDKVDDIAYSNILNKNNRSLFDDSLILYNIKYRSNPFPEPHTYSDGKVTLNCTREVNQKKPFNIKKYIPEADTVEAIWDYNGEPAYGIWLINGWVNDEVTPATTFKNIICSRFESNGYGLSFKDLNIDIMYNSKGTNSLACYFDRPKSIKNLNIKFAKVPKKSVLRIYNSLAELEFKDVKTNANILYLYDPFMFNEFDSFAAKIFEFPQMCDIDDKNEPEGPVKMLIKNFKKAKSICNNQKRYSINHDPILVLKKGAKLSDMIDIKKFSDLETVTFADNNIALIFQTEKPKSYLACMPPHERVNPPRTADGFYVYLECRK